MGQWRRPMRSQPSATPSPPASKSISRSFITGKTVSHLSFNNRLHLTWITFDISNRSNRPIYNEKPRYIDLVAISIRFSPFLPPQELVISILSSRDLVSDRLFFFSPSKEIRIFFFSSSSSFKIRSNTRQFRSTSGKINFNRETRSVNVINFCGARARELKVQNWQDFHQSE